MGTQGDKDRLAADVWTRLQASPRLTLGQIATLLSLERHTLARMIKSYHCCTFRDLKARAFRLTVVPVIRDDQKLLKEIAWDFGYSSHSAFTRRVRALVGLSPSGVRVRR